MQFNVKDWRRYYDRVKKLGNYYKDSLPDHEGNPAKKPLSLEASIQLQDDIKILVDKSKHYLDACNLRLKPPMWEYNPKDKRTWASHESFAYGHLMEFNK